MIIGVDFDGTCVTHEFPNVGKEIGAAEILKALTDRGHQIILFTIRSYQKEGAADSNTLGYADPEKIELPLDTLDDAINWFKIHDIPLYGVNENPNQKSWSQSPKPYCHVYIDDSAVGCPLKYDFLSDRPYVDWEKVDDLLFAKGFYHETN